MQIRQTNVGALTASERLSLLELFQGYFSAHMDWNRLHRKITNCMCWLLCDGETVAGCALMDSARTYLKDAVVLTELVYRWEYNEEPQIHQMLNAVAEAARPRFSYLLLDVNRLHELNMECYRRFGLRDSILSSPKGRENTVLIMDLRRPCGQTACERP